MTTVYLIAQFAAGARILESMLGTSYLMGLLLFTVSVVAYTTYGGFWEWAPPDFHFRMPYWPHMMGWLKYVERLSYLLSQGDHVADVAIMYPVAPLQARNGGKTQPAYDAAQVMFNAGLDFDFIERGAQQGLDKNFEWVAAFGLLVTIVWLYLEMLRLLSKLRQQ